MNSKAALLKETIEGRRSCRHFLNKTVPADLIRENWRGGQGADVFRRHHFPTAAQMILQESAQRGVNPEGVSLLPYGCEVPSAVSIQEDFQIAVLGLP